MTTRVTDLFLDGDHASIPAAGSTPVGALYACSTHDLIYKNDGAAWPQWATLGAGALTAEDVRDTIAAALAAGPGATVTVNDGADTITIGATEVLMIAVSDEATAITTGNAKVTFRMPFALTLTGVRASLTTASSSGIPTVDINEGGSTILSTKLTIDASEKTSTTAATPAVISDAALADDAEITIDIDVAGTGAAGLKVYLIGTRV